jgi:CRP/FNR family transcriptional regulator
MIRGFPPDELYLPMSRRDIASHLEVTPETISRLLKKFQQKKVIKVENRSVSIIDQSQLESLVHCHALETTRNQIEVSRIA